MRHTTPRSSIEAREKQMMKRLPENLRRWLIDDNPKVTKEQKVFLDDFSKALKEAIRDQENNDAQR